MGWAASGPSQLASRTVSSSGHLSAQSHSLRERKAKGNAPDASTASLA
jgi:hypothetical protein